MINATSPNSMSNKADLTANQMLSPNVLSDSPSTSPKKYKKYAMDDEQGRLDLLFSEIIIGPIVYGEKKNYMEFDYSILTPRNTRLGQKGKGLLDWEDWKSTFREIIQCKIVYCEIANRILNREGVKTFLIEDPHQITEIFKKDFLEQGFIKTIPITTCCGAETEDFYMKVGENKSKTHLVLGKDGQKLIVHVSKEFTDKFIRLKKPEILKELDTFRAQAKLSFSPLEKKAEKAIEITKAW